MRDHLRYLRKLKRKYLFIRSGELLLFSLGACSIILLLGHLVRLAQPLAIILTLAIGLTIFCIAFFTLRLHKLKEQQFISFINQHYPDLQQSADLLFMDADKMSSLEHLQRESVDEQFQKLRNSITLPHRMGRALAFFATCAVLSFSVSLLINETKPETERQHDQSAKNNAGHAGLPASVKKVITKVNPPAYTRLRSFETTDPDVTIPAGSVVSWNVEFTDTVVQAALIFSDGDSLISSGTDDHRFTKSLRESTLYQLAWQSLEGDERYSKHFKIEVIPDQAPKIIVPEQPQYRELDFNDDLNINVTSMLSDDYALTDAYIIATVSKGTGESVKFREEKLAFISPQEVRGREVQAIARIGLQKLGLTPGDELYFYIEALDNQFPQPNRARTETFFIALRDTTSVDDGIDGSMGADLMPEYFRSQRQIIIDSEKLLREKKVVPQAEFNRRSNYLAHDQKMLRLKYGEFLGEEFESSIGPSAAEHAGEDHEAGEDDTGQDPLKEYTHQHDTDNDHNLVPEKKNAIAHDHEADDGKSEDPLAAYTHVHDDPEEATFFSESIRTKLKAALTLMWDAELHLRLADPATSLPYQYKALRLLKEISNASRIYVHKTGFDPPPLKEDRRLTGDLSEVKSSRQQSMSDRQDPLPAVRYALQLAENKLQGRTISMTRGEINAMIRAGHELAARSREEPGKYLEALAAINSLSEDRATPGAVRRALILIRKALWTALPDETLSPVKSTKNHHNLDVKFVEKLESIKE